MRYKIFKDKIVVRVDKGEEIVENLKQICKDFDIKLGTIMGIGATDKATIGLFDTKTKQYHSTDFIGEYEIAPLYGNITTMNNYIYLHLHVNLCDKKHKSYGGHLHSSVVSATFEGVITIIDGKVDRKFHEPTGLNLISF
jgi:predicted DNA-binding protein with PD1-like motif